MCTPVPVGPGSVQGNIVPLAEMAIERERGNIAPAFLTVFPSLEIR